MNAIGNEQRRSVRARRSSVSERVVDVAMETFEVPKTHQGLRDLLLRRFEEGHPLPKKSVESALRNIEAIEWSETKLRFLGTFTRLLAGGLKILGLSIFVLLRLILITQVLPLFIYCCVGRTQSLQI